MSERIIALAGNPNVGKSTVFNGLTGLHQHTGNWPGKTVSSAEGCFALGDSRCLLADLPGCYSLIACSEEEEAARDYILSGRADLTVVVCDAACLERNLNLVFQILEITPRVLVCLNLMDEARRRGIFIDIPLLSQRLGVPVAGITARDRGGARKLLPHIQAALASQNSPMRPAYPGPIVKAAQAIEELLPEGTAHPQYTAMRLLDGTLSPEGLDIGLENLETIKADLSREGFAGTAARDAISSSLSSAAEEVCRGAVSRVKQDPSPDRRIDRVITGRVLSFPIMLLLLGIVFWITIVGANYPSAALSSLLLGLQDKLLELCRSTSLPGWLYEMLLLGVFRVAAWVVAVMLPPMAIFFPLFTLLEDLGYLPRVAFNLDKCFKGCRACGKQALTMWVIDKRMRVVYGNAAWMGGDKGKDTCGILPI